MVTTYYVFVFVFSTSTVPPRMLNKSVLAFYCFYWMMLSLYAS